MMPPRTGLLSTLGGFDTVAGLLKIIRDQAGNTGLIPYDKNFFKSGFPPYGRGIPLSM